MDSIISGLRTTAQELEELRVQVALGKAELKDVFETQKHQFRSELQQLQHTMRELRNEEAIRPLVNAMEHLQVQLALGIAETNEAFQEQHKKVEHSLAALEAKLSAALPEEQLAALQLSMERFRSKLELMSLAYRLKKMKLEFKLLEKKEELEEKLEEWREELQEKTAELKENWAEKKQVIGQMAKQLKSFFLPID